MWRWRIFLWFDRLTNRTKIVTTHDLADNNDKNSIFVVLIFVQWKRL